MGIPKAFRWLSERYPLISQLIQENRIPEFDNLYLDMNGIIHNCSHNNNEDVNFRITEEQIFLQVFAYIEHLFSKIKPQKLFFMAIDGVAPRAKMNQQRSRRFRAAKEANDRVLEAKRKGEDIPANDDDEIEAFQSNVITPGTPFMAHLTASLKYFINKKITEDADWRGVQVVLSGHEVPGEGEHKVMEYIRLAKAQPDYNPNTRHCLYGLDADLIMLGLLSHDPHFCLLREEVVFGPAKARASKKGLESTNFHLMHLSLLREYLDIEFADLKHSMSSENPYDLERIIDDFILLAIFIGNDFLPHLPDLHINEGALNLLFGIYKKILPGAGGYLNENGKLNTQRLQLVLDELSLFEREKFQEENADSSWIRLKNAGKDAEKHATKNSKGAKLGVTQAQRKLLTSVKTFVLSNLESPTLKANLELPASQNASDRAFLQNLGDELKLDISFDEFDGNNDPVIVVRLSEEIVEMLQDDENESEIELEQGKRITKDGVGEDSDGQAEGEEEWEDEDDEDELHENDDGDTSPELDHAVSALGAVKLNGLRHDNKQRKATASISSEEVDEWRQAVDRIFAKYDKAPNTREIVKSASEHQADYEQFVDRKLLDFKSDYYREKLAFDIQKTPKDLEDMAFVYIEGLQWVLHYYYDGVASWSWFYPYHYSPKISDLINVPDMIFNFDLNKPFRPFEQLMGVLPELSNTLVPIPYRDLMTNQDSPIKDFYPQSFELDLNGKKQDWEAIVKIPFLNADRLLAAMAPRESLLTEEERQRNTFGNSYQFAYDATLLDSYPSSSPGFFPDLYNCRCRVQIFHLPTLGGLRLVKGLCDGALLGKLALPGFPSLYTLPHTSHLAYHSVNVFQADSRNESVVLSIEDRFQGQSVEQIAQNFLGKNVFSGWPFLQEAKVVAVSDENLKYTVDLTSRAMVPTQNSPAEKDKWRKVASRLEHVYSKRFATQIEAVEVILHVKLLNGLKRLDDGALVKDFDESETEQSVQTIVDNLAHEDSRYAERPPLPIEQEFPEASKVFFLGEGSFGTPSIVAGHSDERISIQIAFFLTDRNEPHIFAARTAAQAHTRYFPSFVVTKQVRMSALTLSKITSGLMIEVGTGQRINVGLNLKFEAKSQKVLGYAQRNEQGWEYSQKAIDLILEYKEKFPEVPKALDAKRGDLTRASDFFPDKTEERIKQLKDWINEKGVRDFEKVSLYSDQMEKEGVQDVEALQNKLYAAKNPATMKHALLKNIPRRAILKPEHAASRLQHQRFSVGDRIITVQETGSVPLAVKGVVVGIQAGFIDVVFDIAFMGGTTFGGRCSPYRGMSILSSHILNLSDVQFMQTTKPVPEAAQRVPKTNGSAEGRLASATAHPTYKGVAHRGHLPTAHGNSAGRGFSNGQVRILGRGGKAMTGNYAAASQGSEEAYVPVTQSENLLRSITGRDPRPQTYDTRLGPGRLQAQDYRSVPPPTALTQAPQVPPYQKFTRGGGHGNTGRTRGSACTNGHSHGATADTRRQPENGAVEGIQAHAVRGGNAMRRPRGRPMVRAGIGARGHANNSS